MWAGESDSIIRDTDGAFSALSADVFADDYEAADGQAPGG
jgi:hypothetical protein